MTDKYKLFEWLSNFVHNNEIVLFVSNDDGDLIDCENYFKSARYIIKFSDNNVNDCEDPNLLRTTMIVLISNNPLDWLKTFSKCTLNSEKMRVFIVSETPDQFEECYNLLMNYNFAVPNIINNDIDMFSCIYDKFPKRHVTLECLYLNSEIYYSSSNILEEDVLRSLRAGIEYQSYIIDWGKIFTPIGGCIIDCGVLYGHMTVAWAKYVGNEGKIYSIEAMPEAAKLCKMAFNSNGVNNNITLIENAVYNVDDINLFFPNNNGAVTSLEMKIKNDNHEDDNHENDNHENDNHEDENEDNIVVKTITLDTVYDKYNIDREVHFIKIDCQGSDLNAMKGATKLIDKYRMPIVFEYEEDLSLNHGCKWEDYLYFIESINYSILRKLNVDFLIVPNEKRDEYHFLLLQNKY